MAARRRAQSRYKPTSSARVEAKTVVHNFDSVGDYVRFVTDKSRTAPAGLTQSSEASGHNERSFSGTATFDEAVSLVEKGWAEGAEKVAHWRGQLACFLDAAKTAKSRQFAWDVTGDFVDVGKYLTGEPECFGSDADDGQQIASRVVSIRLNACVSGALQADAIVARGVAVLVAVDLLESLGRRCEVTVSQATSTSGGYGGHAGSTPDLNLDCNVIVKRPGEPVDIDRLAYTVAHPSWFRRLGFKFMELGGHSPSGCRVSDMTDKGRREGVVEVDSLLTFARLSEDSLREHVLEIVKACGLEFTEEQLAAIASSAVE